MGDAKPQSQQATTTKSNVCIKEEKSSACMVTEDVMYTGGLIYGGNLNFWPHSEVRFLSKTCIAESGQWVFKFSALSRKHHSPLASSSGTRWADVDPVCGRICSMGSV